MADSLKNPAEFTARRCRTVDDCEKKIVDPTEPPAISMNMDVPIT